MLENDCVMRLVVYPIALALLISFDPALASSSASSPDPAEIEKLIRQLGDEDMDVRDRAEAKLVAAGEDIVPKLEAARSTDDPEIAERIESVLSKMPRWWHWTAWIGQTAVDGRTGEKLWEFPDAADSAVVGHEVFVLARDGLCERLSLKDGQPIWKSESDSGLESTSERRISVSSSQVVCVNPRWMQAFGLNRGAKLWTVNIEAEKLKSPRVVSSGAGILLMGTDSCSYYDPAAGKKLWTETGIVRSALVLPDGDAIINSTVSICRHRRSDGKKVWETISANNIDQYRICVAGPWLVVGPDRPTGDARTEVFDLESGKKQFEKEGWFSTVSTGGDKSVYEKPPGSRVIETFGLNPSGWQIEPLEKLRRGKADGSSRFLIFRKSADGHALQLARVRQDFAKPFTPIGEEEEEQK
jgi:hypothetical protein